MGYLYVHKLICHRTIWAELNKNLSYNPAQKRCIGCLWFQSSVVWAYGLLCECNSFIQRAGVKMRAEDCCAVWSMFTYAGFMKHCGRQQKPPLWLSICEALVNSIIHHVTGRRCNLNVNNLSLLILHEIWIRTRSSCSSVCAAHICVFAHRDSGSNLVCHEIGWLICSCYNLFLQNKAVYPKQNNIPIK